MCVTTAAPYWTVQVTMLEIHPCFILLVDRKDLEGKLYFHALIDHFEIFRIFFALNIVANVHYFPCLLLSCVISPHCYFIFMLSSMGNGVHRGSFTAPSASPDNFFMPPAYVHCCRMNRIDLQSSSPSCQATTRESDRLGVPHLDLIGCADCIYCIALQIWLQS